MYDELVKSLRDCAEVNSLSLYKRGLMKQAADAIEQLTNAGSAYGRGWTLGYDAGREESNPCWTPVTERLPKDEETVLTWGKQGTILLDWRHDNKWCCFGEATHWMPLPQPPKEE